MQGRSFTLSGLSAGETVRFTVQAVNSVGVSDGATAEGIARDAPTAPTNLSAQRGNGVVTLAWGAPAQLNGATLQGYEIVYGSETQSVGANATGYTATGLSNGTELRISRLRQERLRQRRGGYHHRQAGDNAERARQPARRICRQSHNPAMGFGNGRKYWRRAGNSVHHSPRRKSVNGGRDKFRRRWQPNKWRNGRLFGLCRKCGGRKRDARDNQRIRQHNARRANGFASARWQRRYNLAMERAKRQLAGRRLPATLWNTRAAQ